LTSYIFKFELSNEEVSAVLQECSSKLRENRNHLTINHLLRNLGDSYDISKNKYQLVVRDSEFFLIDSALKAIGINIWDRMEHHLESTNNFSRIKD